MPFLQFDSSLETYRTSILQDIIWLPWRRRARLKKGLGLLLVRMWWSSRWSIWRRALEVLLLKLRGWWPLM